MKYAAVLYTRVSTEEQVQGGVSLKDQEEKLLAYCKLQGLEPVHIIREEGISAGKPLATRPGGQELLQLVKRGGKWYAGTIKYILENNLYQEAA